MKHKRKRIIFAGGTDWSTDFLKLLVDEGFNIVSVMTPPCTRRYGAAPDSQKGRRQKIAAHVLKLETQRLHIPVFQPKELNDSDFLREFKKMEPDLIVVVAYGRLFPKEILSIPPLGFINFHPSLLPELRGPSPIIGAILEGYRETGVSIMKLGEGMDDGPVLAQRKVKIDARETSETLTKKLVDLGKKLLPKILKYYLVETQKFASLREQDNSKATYCRLIRKEDGHIDWQRETAEQIDRKIRALNPQFKTFTFLKRNNKKLRINVLKSSGIQVETQNFTSLPAGQYKLIDNNLAVGTKKDTLFVSKLQVEGKNSITAAEFMRGYSSIENKFLLV